MFAPSSYRTPSPGPEAQITCYSQVAAQRERAFRVVQVLCNQQIDQEDKIRAIQNFINDEKNILTTCGEPRGSALLRQAEALLRGLQPEQQVEAQQFVAPAFPGF